MKLLSGALALWLCAAGQDFDKTKHPWTKWKVESFAKYKVTIEAAGQTLDGEYKSSLAELKEKEYSTRHVFSFMGADQEETETESFPEKKGEEKIKVGEKEHACVVWASSGKRGEKELSSKTWISGATEVALKMTWKAGAGETGEFTATKLGDKVDAGGKEFDAVLLEGEMTTDELGTMKGKLWLAASVPGGILKMELASDQGKVLIQLVEVDAKQ